MQFRDRVLENAKINEGDSVLDVGCGDGLIGFGALDYVGPSGTVTFSDVSDDLLNECRSTAEALGVTAQCSFVKASADDLSPIRDESLDVVATRSVLIYLADKAPAFKEFFRVLKPGGRISLFEPINRFGKTESDNLFRFRGFDVTPVQHLAKVVKEQFLSPHEHPLLNFDERDLLRFACDAGFRRVRLDYTADVDWSSHWAADAGWDTYIRMSGNPLDPTLEEAMNEALTAGERQEFERFFRAQVEARGEVPTYEASAYLTATKHA